MVGDILSHGSHARISQRSLVLGMALAVAFSITSCTSDEEKLKDANCEGKVLTSREDGQKILELAPDGIDEFKSVFRESASQGYLADCSVRDADGEERPAIVIDAGFLTDETDPSELPLHELDPSFPVDGHKMRITSRTPRVGGVSGEADATLRAPCSLSESKTLPPDLRDGMMYIAAWTDDAPEADSMKQRQNAADLALSFLRHAVQKCDEPPKLPKSVRIHD